jgi:hypothetical protein
MAVRLLVWTLALSSLALAQEPAPSAPPAGSSASPASSSAIPGPSSPQWRALSVEEKLRYDGRHLVDVENVIFAGIGAAFDQWRERPGQWGEGFGAFGDRYASHLGQYLVQRSIMFPVQAIDHEDPRYFRSRSTTYRGRLLDALLHTVWRHNDRGGMMPAFGEFLGDYGAAAVSRMWWPRQYHTGSAIFIAGSDTMLVDAGINIFHEFTPDVKRWLRFKR